METSPDFYKDEDTQQKLSDKGDFIQYPSMDYWNRQRQERREYIKNHDYISEDLFNLKLENPQEKYKDLEDYAFFKHESKIVQNQSIVGAIFLLFINAIIFNFGLIDFDITTIAVFSTPILMLISRAVTFMFLSNKSFESFKSLKNNK